jgi:hypothetical protein
LECRAFAVVDLVRLRIEAARFDRQFVPGALFGVSGLSGTCYSDG